MKGLAAGLFEPRDILDIFQPLQHLPIRFDGEDDRDGFATPGDYLGFYGQRTRETSLTDSSRGANLRSTFDKRQWGYCLRREGEARATEWRRRKRRSTSQREERASGSDLGSLGAAEGRGRSSLSARGREAGEGGFRGPIQVSAPRGISLR